MKNAITGSRVAGAEMAADAAVGKLWWKIWRFGRANSAVRPGEGRSGKTKAKPSRSQCLPGRLRSRPCRPRIPRRDLASSAASRRSSALARSAPNAAPTSISTAGWSASMPSQPRRRTRTTPPPILAPHATPARPERAARRDPAAGAATEMDVACDKRRFDTAPGLRCSRRLRQRSWTAPGRASITRRARLTASHREPGAQVAQLVEHVTENHGVGGSIPPLGTTLK